MSLLRCKPHKDFGPLDDLDGTRIRLVEAQLLTQSVRTYALSDPDMLDIESYIAETAAEMEMALEGTDSGSLTPWLFLVAAYPGVCPTCPFKRPCWENDHDWSSDEHIPNHESQLALF